MLLSRNVIKVSFIPVIERVEVKWVILTCREDVIIAILIEESDNILTICIYI